MPVSERALHRFLWLHRMNVREALHPRHFFIEPRVMLHGAAAKREQPKVNRIILAR
jgi:hypothetical protein